MSMLQLTDTEKDRIVSSSHPEPRSILGFHEVQKNEDVTVWIVRVLEPDAESVRLWWEDQKEEQAQTLKKIHPGGLFEIVMKPHQQLVPYNLKLRYPDGTEISRHDPYFFSPQFTEYDRYLFHQGTHHHIYQKMGAHPMTLNGIAGTWFSVWAPNAKRVSVIGDFNHWDGRKHQMNMHVASGIWELFIPGIGVGTLYKFEIKTQFDQIRSKTDPYAFQMEVRPNTASVVADLDNYNWNDQAWIDQRERKNQLAEPINVYEVHLGSWKRIPEQGNRYLTYRELADQLVPYVREMGYTHLELMPVAEHPLDASWGYQVTGYYAPTSRYGTPQDFMYFVDVCHQNGIGVIIDWVPAHFPKDDFALNWFDGTHLYEHQDWRMGEHKEWGTLVFNFGRHEVKNFLISNALFWFDYYHIDGIRVDAVSSMLYLDYNRKDGQWLPNEYGGRENIAAINFMRELNQTIFHYYPGALSIAEESTSWGGVSHPPYTGGLGFNFKWNMGWMNDTLRYMSKEPVWRSYDHHLITFSLIYAFHENFVLSLSHDEVVHGKGSLLNKMPGDDWQKRANFRTYMCFQMGHPGKKLLMMGCEFGQWQEWAEWRSLDWHLLDHPDHRALCEFMRDLNWFYRHHPTLFSNDFDWSGFEWIDLHDHQHSVLSFLRRSSQGYSDPDLIFVFNFTPVPRNGYFIGVPQEGWYHKLIDTDAHHYGGSGYNQQYDIHTENIPWHNQKYRLRLDLPPLGALVLSQGK